MIFKRNLEIEGGSGGNAPAYLRKSLSVTDVLETNDFQIVVRGSVVKANSRRYFLKRALYCDYGSLGMSSNTERFVQFLGKNVNSNNMKNSMIF